MYFIIATKLSEHNFSCLYQYSVTDIPSDDDLIVDVATSEDAADALRGTHEQINRLHVFGRAA